VTEPSPDGTRDLPPLKIKSTADMVEWLTSTIGTGDLAGMFTRAGREIVHCPHIGESGYTKATRDERDDDGPAQIRPLSASTIASFIQLRYWCHRVVEDHDGNRTKVAAMFPKDAARPAVDHPAMQPHLRPLRGITHCPLPRTDGSILDTPGYDPATKLLYLPNAGLEVEPVPTDPTAGQAADALKLLRWVIKDFRFLTIHDQANYLGLMLTPLLRELAPPPYKLGAIGAPQPGSGKSLLASILRILFGGVFRSEVPQDDAEMRKAITTMLDVTTGPVVTLDNVSGVLRSSVLAGLLTSATWEDRRLGSNSQIVGRNDRLWTLTGNNLTLGGDLVRRTVWVTIDPAVPDPHLRTGFDLPDLERYVRDHRAELLHALLVLIRYWACRGAPRRARGSDSYATWTEVVDGILTTAGHEGTFDHRDSARQTIGTDDSEWREFLETVHAVFGTDTWTVKELLAKVHDAGELAVGNSYDPAHPISLDALPAELAEKAARSRNIGLINKSLGRWLANRDGRWAGNLTVRRQGETDHVKRWQIKTTNHGDHHE
jgi:hypothetical protein